MGKKHTAEQEQPRGCLSYALAGSPATWDPGICPSTDRQTPSVMLQELGAPGVSNPREEKKGNQRSRPATAWALGFVPGLPSVQVWLDPEEAETGENVFWVQGTWGRTLPAI